MAILGVDVGGTFTDAVLLDGDRLATAKVPTEADQAESVLAAARAVGAAAVERFTHGTPIATNALLERAGAKTALVTTAGFEHLLHLRRQARAHLYRLCEPHPEPLVPLERVVGVRERIGPDGVLEELDLESLPELDAEAVAVCLLFSFRDPSHERAVAEEVRRRLPRAHVAASHEVAPEFREFERASTTAADAYLGPVVAGYARSLGRQCADEGLPEPLVMRSSGGVASLEEVAEHPAIALVSGPAAGVVGAARMCALAGLDDAVSFDMGGTSTDVCLVLGGAAGRAAEKTVGGLPIRLPTVDLHTVGAGGGSIAWIDSGGALRVGPRSAGAEPGPACYGRGGGEPTVTDADLVLGRIRGDAAFPGLGRLDVGAARRVLDRAGVDAAGVGEVVDAAMEQAVRVVSVARGVDPTGLALVAFGGAGPLHACAIAGALGMAAVVVPPRAGVLSAVGLLCSPRQRELVRSWPVPSVHDELDRALAALAAEARAAVGAGAEVETAVDCRYAGQSHELTVRSIGEFADEHRSRNGYA